MSLYAFSRLAPIPNGKKRAKVVLEIRENEIVVLGVWPGWEKAIVLALTGSHTHPYNETLLEVIKDMENNAEGSLYNFEEVLYHAGVTAVDSLVPHNLYPMQHVHDSPSERYDIERDTLKQYLQNHGRVRVGPFILTTEFDD